MIMSPLTFNVRSVVSCVMPSRSFSHYGARDRIFSELKQRLAKRELIMIDLK